MWNEISTVFTFLGLVTEEIILVAEEMGAFEIDKCDSVFLVRELG